jgi:hypothetical protein
MDGHLEVDSSFADLGTFYVSDDMVIHIARTW